MPESPLISIIVPIYKVEMYLQECVDSILMQTYTNLEVILVDDGSPDSCPQICDDYAVKDKRIRALHKKNGGLSDARNAGIDIAKGEYLFFIDSDDWIAPNTIESLLNDIAKHDADISCCNYYISYINANVPAVPCEQLLMFTNEQAASAVLAHELKQPAAKSLDQSAWAKLYKRYLFDMIRYPCGKVFEDGHVICDILALSGRVTFNPEPLYYYRERKSSIKHAPVTAAKIMSKLEMYEKRQDGICTNFPELSSMGEAVLNGFYIRTAVLLVSDSDLRNTPGSKDLAQHILHNINQNVKCLYRNPYLTKNEKRLLRILAVRSYKIASLLLKVRKRLIKYTRKQKNKNKNITHPLNLVAYN